MKSMKQIEEKSKYQKKVNPGHKKDKYVPMPRPRSVSFKTKKDYNRAHTKKSAKEAMYDN